MTPIINEWAIKHHVSKEAVLELQVLFGMHGGHIAPRVGNSESAVQNEVRLEAADKGIRLYRNNVGALPDQRGVPIRFGLANDSPQLNKEIKSSDLIGWRPLVISRAHVGSTIAQFVSRETKAPDWHYKATPREVAQLAWLQLVVASGGDASFCTGRGSFG